MRALVIAAALVAAPFAAAQAQVNPSFAAAPAGDYALDLGHTSVLFRVSHLGLSMYTGRFSAIEGTLTVDPKTPTNSKVSISIDANSVDTGHRDAQGGRSFDTKIAKDAFGAEANPKITFVSTSLTQSSPTTGQMAGNLTLNGVTKPVTFDVTFYGGQPMRFAGGRYGVGFAAKATIKRSEFGVEDWIPVVGDDTQIIVESEFIQKATPAPAAAPAPAPAAPPRSGRRN
jgi:polyisoprenoid-binding protein YceI